MLIGHDVLSQHGSVQISFKGKRDDLKVSNENNLDYNSVCGVTRANIQPVSLFSSIPPDCKPIACKSRKYSEDDEEFISVSTNSLLKEGSIEPSKSAWRAQVLVVQETDNHRRRKTR